MCEEDPRFGEYYKAKRLATYHANTSSSKLTLIRAKKGLSYNRRRKNDLPQAKDIPRLERAAEARKLLKQDNGEPKKKRRKKVTDDDLVLAQAQSVAGTGGRRRRLAVESPGSSETKQ